MNLQEINEKLVGKTLQWENDGAAPGKQHGSIKVGSIRRVEGKYSAICIYDENGDLRQMWPMAVIEELINAGKYIFTYDDRDEIRYLQMQHLTAPDMVTENTIVYTLAE